jgi:hypothetical protein
MKLYRRSVVLTLSGRSGLKIENLKMAFRVDKTISGQPNKATIDIWNLSAAHRGVFKDEFTRLRLEAGYLGEIGAQGNVGIIFDGHIRDVVHKRQGTDIVTHLECGDGDKGIREGTINKTLPPGTTVKDVVGVLREAMEDVDEGPIQGLDDAPAFDREVTLCGPITRELDKIGRTHQVHWSIQDGVLEIIPGTSAINDVVVIGQDTGMIGAPSVTDKGVNVECLLNPQIRANRMVRVISTTVDVPKEDLRVSSVAFEGDNQNGAFKAIIEAERLEG